MLPGLWLRFPGPKRLTEPTADLGSLPVDVAQKGEPDAPDGLFGVGDSNVGNLLEIWCRRTQFAARSAVHG